MKIFFSPIDDNADGVALQLIETYLNELNAVFTEITEKEIELFIEPSSL